MKNPILRYGLIAGGVMIILSFLPLLIWGSDIDYSKGEFIGYTSMIISLAVIFFGIRAYRDQTPDGILNFSRGLKAGTLMGLIAAGLFGIYSWILYRFVMPEFLMDYWEYSKEQIRNSEQSQAVISEKITEMENMAGVFLNPEIQALVMFATVFVIAVLVALVSSFILKNNTE